MVGCFLIRPQFRMIVSVGRCSLGQAATMSSRKTWYGSPPHTTEVPTTAAIWGRFPCGYFGRALSRYGRSAIGAEPAEPRSYRYAWVREEVGLTEEAVHAA